MWCSKVSQIFRLCPSIRARAVFCEAPGVEFKLTHLAHERVLLFVDMLLTPVTVWIDDGTRPITTVAFIMARMEVQIAAFTMLCNDLWY